jgi:crotonobetainyl-CoA:carnitine CoA-transferase CaiB-like acyl-CoA transferase
LASRQGWVDYLESDLRPAIEEWAASTKLDACADLSAAGLAPGPCLRDEEDIRDPHVASHRTLVELPRTDGVDQPVLIPASPIKRSKVAEGPNVGSPGLASTPTKYSPRSSASLTPSWPPCGRRGYLAPNQVDGP